MLCCACAVPPRWCRKDVPRLGSWLLCNVRRKKDSHKAKSTGPMDGGTRASSRGRATRLGLRREDESRMRPLQRLRRPRGSDGENAREHQEGRKEPLAFLGRGKARPRFAAQSLALVAEEGMPCGLDFLGVGSPCARLIPAFILQTVCASVCRPRRPASEPYAVC